MMYLIRNPLGWPMAFTRHLSLFFIFMQGPLGCVSVDSGDTHKDPVHNEEGEDSIVEA